MKGSMDILKLSDIIEKFIEEHKELENTGRGMWFDKEPERDLDIKYKKQDYVITIRRMEK